MPYMPRRRHKAPEGVCERCDELREQEVTFHPPHDPYDYCPSGKDPHCSCSSCF